MPRTESWEDVARALGDRMQYQAFNCPVGRPNPGVSAGDPDLVHKEPHLHVEDCPFCADTVAYLRFQARLAGVPYIPVALP